jgi:hypothetical protein
MTKPVETATTTVRLPADLLKNLKIAAINEDRPLHDIVTDALRSYFSTPGGGDGAAGTSSPSGASS